VSSRDGLMALETKSICDSRFLLPCCRSCEIIKIYPLEFTKSRKFEDKLEKYKWIKIRGKLARA
jgi:hypothetical protein